MDADRPLDEALRGAADDVLRAAATAGRRSPVPQRRAGSWWTAGLVAAAVAAVIAVPVVLLGGADRRPAPGAAAGASRTPSAPVGGSRTSGSAVAPSMVVGTLPGDPACGSELPVPLYLPDGYRGPLPGPATGAPEPERPEQLVLHWSGPGGDIEARWPMQFGGGSGTSDYLTMTGPTGSDPDVVASIKVPKRSGECEVLSLAIYGEAPRGFGNPLAPFQGSPEDPPEVRAKFAALATLATDPKELTPVSGSRRLGTAPKAAIRCSGGDVPNRSGTVRDPVPQQTPEAALLHYFVKQDGFTEMNVGTGLLKLLLPDGAVMFGKPFDIGPGYVGLVWMRQTGAGWVVDRWETSGC